MTDALPAGWVWISVSDLASAPQDITDGPFGSNLKTEHYTTTGPRVIRLQNIGDGVFLDEEAHIASGHFERLRKHEVKAGDVIVAMLGERLPRACVAPSTLGLAIVKADCVRLRPDFALTHSKFVSAGLNSAAVRQQGVELVHGVGRPRLGLKWFRTLRFPLAPIAEQERVVDAIDSYLTRLDDAVASLKRVQVKLKAYRASVLTAAVEGRLVPTEASLARAERRAYEPAEALLARILKERRRRWEKTELAKLKAKGRAPKDDTWKASYKEPAAPDTSALPHLPEGWCWARLEAVSDVILGQQRSPAHAAAQITVPYIRAANITWAGLDLSDVKRMGFVNPERHRLDSGDVLLSEASGSPMEAGKPAIWRGEIAGACFQNTVLRVRPVDKATILPEFLRLIFLRDCVTGQFARLAPGVGIVHIGAERLAQWSVPLASLPEQRRIVEEVERVLSVADQNAINVEHDIKRCIRLRQAVLKWAFEGRLVDQNPIDEPAGKLLARIRAERAAVPPMKKSVGRRDKGAA